MNTHDKGDLVRCTGTFKNKAGDLLDPTTVRFKFKDPTGTETTYTYQTDAQLVRSSIGVFYVDLNANLSGIFHYRFEGLGFGQSAKDSSFAVADSHF